MNAFLDKMGFSPLVVPILEENHNLSQFLGDDQSVMDYICSGEAG